MRARMLLVVALLTVWVLGGSVALTLDLCPNMAAPCEAPCGLGATLVENAASGAVPLPPAALEALSGPGLQTCAVRGLDPVPRPLRLSA